MIFAVLIGRKGSEGFPEKIKEGIDVLNENPDYDYKLPIVEGWLKRLGGYK